MAGEMDSVEGAGVLLMPARDLQAERRTLGGSGTQARAGICASARFL